MTTPDIAEARRLAERLVQHTVVMTPNVTEDALGCVRMIRALAADNERLRAQVAQGSGLDELRGLLRAEVDRLTAAPSLTVGERARLTVRLQSFPESNGKRNWTALLVRVEKWDGLIGNCGGISLAHGELWNRVAYEAERAKLLIGERTTEPDILDYGDDIETPDHWPGEVCGGRPVKQQPQPAAQAEPVAPAIEDAQRLWSAAEFLRAVWSQSGWTDYQISERKFKVAYELEQIGNRLAATSNPPAQGVGELPKPFGYVSDGFPDGLHFQHEPWPEMHTLFHSTAPVYSHAQMRAALAQAQKEQP